MDVSTLLIAFSLTLGPPPVTSLNPFGPENEAVFEPALVGPWVSGSVLVKDGNAYAQMRDGNQVARVRMFNPKGWFYTDVAPTDGSRHVFYQVRVLGNRVVLRPLDSERTIQFHKDIHPRLTFERRNMVSPGKLSLELPERPDSAVTLTATTKYIWAAADWLDDCVTRSGGGSIAVDRARPVADTGLFSQQHRTLSYGLEVRDCNSSLRSKAADPAKQIKLAADRINALSTAGVDAEAIEYAHLVRDWLRLYDFTRQTGDKTEETQLGLTLAVQACEIRMHHAWKELRKRYKTTFPIPVD